MYVRVKRKAQTVFLNVEPSNSFTVLKKKLGDLTQREAARIRLVASDKVKVLEDEATIGDQQIETDSIIYMLFVDDSGGCEDIDIPIYTADHGEEKAD